ncbi:MAG: hypothetical protein U0Y82_10510 [Thermoleophilia bacterium]
MGLFDILRGERTPPPADLDALFAISTAAPTLTVNLGLRPSGRAGVCFKPVQMAQFDAVLADLDQLLAMDDAEQPITSRRVDDELGFTWLVLSCDDVPALVVATHTVNRTIQDAGFGTQLLCSVFGFQAADGPVLLVYSYKRGRFYPFIPRGERRDSAAELRLQASLEHELPMEPELERWYPVWDAPVLQG